MAHRSIGNPQSWAHKFCEGLFARESTGYGRAPSNQGRVFEDARRYELPCICRTAIVARHQAQVPEVGGIHVDVAPEHRLLP